MLPVIYRFTFESAGAKALLYLLALGIVVYAAWSGWRNAGAVDADGRFVEPKRDERVQRAAIHGIIGALLAGGGLYYALPDVLFFGKGKGEGIPIHTYGVLVGLGFVTAVAVASWLCVQEWPGKLGLLRRDQFLDLAFYLFVAAMVGSRVLFIIVNWKDYAADPLKIFSLGGGLVFYGGLIGAALTAVWYAKRNQIEFLRLADICIPTVSLGQALGRLGCFSAGCCWGDVAKPGTALAVQFPGTNAQNLFGGISGTPSLAWSSQRDDVRWVVEATGEVFHQAVPSAVRISEWVTSHGHTLPVHPTQLYESLGQTVLFLSLLALRRWRRFHGQIFGLWLMGYSTLRTTVELFRGDVERGTLHGLLGYVGAERLAQKVPLEAWYNVSTAQFISLCLFSLGAWTLVRGTRELRAREPVRVASLAA